MQKDNKKNNFELKTINSLGCRESLLRFLDRQTTLSLMCTNRNIRTKVANSYCSNRWYIDYLNQLQNSLDGDIGDNIFYDIANKVYQSDLDRLQRRLLYEKEDIQKKFFYNEETKTINPFLIKCLSIYMFHMILLDLLSITEEDFADYQKQEYSIEAFMTGIINKRQNTRIEKIFDLVVNGKKHEIVTFWDEISAIDSKKRQNLQTDRTSKFRDVIYLYLCRKIFHLDTIQSTVSDIEDQVRGYKNNTQKAIENEITEKENKLAQEQQELEELQKQIKNAEDNFDKSAKSQQLNAFPATKNELLEQITLKKRKESKLQTQIEETKISIANSKDNLDTQKMFDKNSDLISNMLDIAKNMSSCECVFKFLLDNPDKISSAPLHNYQLIEDSGAKYDRGMVDFVSYLLQHYEHQYFYSAIIEAARKINKANKMCRTAGRGEFYSEYYEEGEITKAICTQIDGNIININTNFIRRILLESVYSDKDFSERQLRWIDRNSKITCLDIFLTIFVLISLIFFFVYSILASFMPFILCFATIWMTILFHSLVWVLVLLLVLLSYLSFRFGKVDKTIDFFCEYSNRKKLRVIYDCAISQCNECKQRTEIYKTKLTKQKEIFDKHVQHNKKQPIHEEIKNEKEITT